MVRAYLLLLLCFAALVAQGLELPPLGEEFALAGAGTAVAGSNTLLRVKVGPTQTLIPAGGGLSLGLNNGYRLETSSLASCTLNGQIALSPALVGSSYIFGFPDEVPVGTIIELSCNAGFVLPSDSTADKSMKVATTTDLTGSLHIDETDIGMPDVFTTDRMSERAMVDTILGFTTPRSTGLSSHERDNVLSSIKTTSGLGSIDGLTFGFARLILWSVDDDAHVVTASSPFARATARSTVKQSDLTLLDMVVNVRVGENGNTALIIDIVTAIKENEAAITTALSTLLGGEVFLSFVTISKQTPLCSDQELSSPDGPEETDVDCGGDCFACDDGKACASDRDCLSSSCSATTNTCVGTSDGKTSGASLVAAPASTLAALAIVALLCMLQLVLA